MLSDQADVLYKCTSFYDPQTERGLAWNDPTVGVEWPIQDPILSDRDLSAPSLDELPRYFVYHGN